MSKIMIDNNRRRSRKNLLLATVAVAGLFLLDIVTGGAVRAPVRMAGAALSSAAASALSHISESGIFATRAQLAKENAMLEAQVAALQEQVAAASVAQTQDQYLRAFLHLATSTPGIVAPVLSSFTASPYGTFEIAAGAREGVQAGALVLSSDGFVLGSVSQVSSQQSLVTEVFAPGASLDVVAGGVPLTLSGEGGGNARGAAPRAAVITIGTPALAPAYAQRPVGLVEETQGNASSASLQVYVRMPVNLATLLYVYVMQ